jgi:hypothetical protein
VDNLPCDIADALMEIANELSKEGKTSNKGMKKHGI